MKATMIPFDQQGALALWEHATYETTGITTAFDQSSQGDSVSYPVVCGEPTPFGLFAKAHGLPVGTEVHIPDRRDRVVKFLRMWANMVESGESPRLLDATGN